MSLEAIAVGVACSLVVNAVLAALAILTYCLFFRRKR